MAETLTPPAPLQTAVLFAIFNRPDTTARVFEAIRQAKPPRLYVVADGPRANLKGEVEKVVEARKIATAVDWPCEVKTRFQEQNLGCRRSLQGGINWFFDNEEQGIILEDDCMPSQSFFWFCEEILTRYAHDERVMSVTGTNITRGVNFEGDYFLSNFALIWGWASWRRAWRKYDPYATDWPELKKKKWLHSLSIGGIPFRRVWISHLDRASQPDSDVSFWAIQWIYCCWRHGGLTVAPAKNLVSNIGFSDDATHTTGYNRILDNQPLHNLDWPLKSPEMFEVNLSADSFISKHWFADGNWKGLIKKIILKVPVIARINRIKNRYRSDRRSGVR